MLDSFVDYGRYYMFGLLLYHQFSTIRKSKNSFLRSWPDQLERSSCDIFQQLDCNKVKVKHDICDKLPNVNSLSISVNHFTFVSRSRRTLAAQTKRDSRHCRCSGHTTAKQSLQFSLTECAVKCCCLWSMRSVVLSFTQSLVDEYDAIAMGTTQIMCVCLELRVVWNAFKRTKIEI